MKIDLDQLERELDRGPLFICREGAEQWSGGMAAPVRTFYPVDYSPDVVLALVARVRELEEQKRALTESLGAAIMDAMRKR